MFAKPSKIVRGLALVSLLAMTTTIVLESECVVRHQRQAEVAIPATATATIGSSQSPATGVQNGPSSRLQGGYGGGGLGGNSYGGYGSQGYGGYGSSSYGSGYGGYGNRFGHGGQNWRGFGVGKNPQRPVRPYYPDYQQGIKY